MLAKVIIENGQKKIQALTADTGTGAPVGSYLYLEKKSNPQGYLYCDGSTFDETVYPALYQYLGTNVLPDWREFSPVGAEQNTTNVYDASTNPTGVIHDHDVYTEGESKDDQFQGHYHNYSGPTGWAVNGTGPDTWFSGSVGGTVVFSVTSPRNDGTNGDPRTGTVTRGKSRAVFIYIKATSGLTENQQENVLNTINENNSYSTEEHATGKKWIDGKPIYRKVVQKNIAITNGVDIDLSDIAIDTPISLDYVLQDGAGGSIYAYNNTNITFNFYKSGSTNNAHILINTIGGWDLRQTTQNFIIEYTKTN